jgi:MscS family membrane protein
MISEKWGLNLTGILATLGFFSLAVSLAAKDTVANIFGGISVIFDKPYLIGDTISIGDIQGSVEKIYFRYTVVRTHNQSLVFIPNQLTAQANVSNHSKKLKRPLILNIQIPKNITFEKIDEMLSPLKEVIIKCNNVISEFVIINVNSITQNTININLVCHLKSINHGDYTKTKAEIIKKIAQYIAVYCSIDVDKINIE